MCAAATEVYGYHWDDPPQSSWPENFHDALLGEHIPLLEQFSSQAASSPEEESQVAKKSKFESERSSSIFPISCFSRVDSGSNASTTKLKDKLKKKIMSSGARFRWINEQLYTRMGYEALNMFEQDRTLFDVYHKGFSAQTSK